ncbi:MAG: hypothetical protein AVDCRST_MAG29-277 [uncultured Nocardioidaceae bacterium]|uniref:Glycosyltransferase RgtA/B/C/D-like domain-containing protein n=1 Tax=uncultured Nocardioidaceae bacterium TaxID=253824 RepID=A0A6J4L130_9ACTN|nr:MAG: hypothetical protein AVDCRST_MAG29-277 [uncultured Nocardioidaceae bacterium]
MTESGSGSPQVVSARGRDQRHRRSDTLRVWLLWSVLAAPLAVAAVALRQEHWYPLLDQAVTEMRIRDVWSGDPPLLGLYGRLGPPGREASHPGPLSFLALWPLYQLFGATAWAMQAATACLHAAAIAAALWIAHRRGGTTLAIGFAAALAVLARYYGAFTLTDPWNPYMPVLWWFVFLLAIWSVWCGDLPMLPVAALAGSLCAQTHVSYVGLIFGLGGLAMAAAAIAATRGPPGRRRSSLLLRWSVLAVVVGGLAWAPPLLEEATNRPGNLARLQTYFSDPPDAPIGGDAGLDLLLHHLNPWTLASDRLTPSNLVDPGSPLPGVSMLLTWTVAVGLALRRRSEALLRLHIVVATALVLALVSMSRVFGPLWNYLFLWSRGVLALMLVATVWTFGARVGDRVKATTVSRWTTGARVGLAGVGALATVAFVTDAATVESSRPDLSVIMGKLVPATIEALREAPVPESGGDGDYLVIWRDPTHLGTQGWALLNELERHGFHVGAEEQYSATVRRHRVMQPEDATAVIVLGTGVEVDILRNQAGMEEIAFADPRSPAARAEYERLRSLSKSELRAGPEPELADLLDTNPWAVRFHPAASTGVIAAVERMDELGVPTAIFLAPPEALGPS